MAVAAPTADFDPRSPAFLLDPQATFVELPAVFHHERLNAYFVLRYDDVRRVLEDFETFSAHAYKGVPVRDELRERIPDEWQRVAQVIQGGQSINMDPPMHTVQRRAMQRTFTRRRVEATMEEIAAIANDLVDRIAPEGSCDLMGHFAKQLTSRVIGLMMDVPPDLLAGFQSWVMDTFGVLARIDLRPEDVTTPDDQLAGTFERLHTTYLTYSAFVEERRASPGDDLASAMLLLEDEDGSPALTNDQVLAHLVGITVAGIDSTANLVVNIVRLFTQHPDQLELLAAEPALWENAVLEGLRRSGLSLYRFLVTTREAEVAGVAIPAGSVVCASFAAANADPARFADPLRFDVRRENAAEHLAFGYGRHYCLGAPLAPPEARIALETLYRRLPGLEADLDQELEFVPALTARRIVSQTATWRTD
jgi:cytochrome P450